MKEDSGDAPARPGAGQEPRRAPLKHWGGTGPAADVVVVQTRRARSRGLSCLRLGVRVHQVERRRVERWWWWRHTHGRRHRPSSASIQEVLRRREALGRPGPSLSRWQERAPGWDTRNPEEMLSVIIIEETIVAHTSMLAKGQA